MPRRCDDLGHGRTNVGGKLAATGSRMTDQPGHGGDPHLKRQFAIASGQGQRFARTLPGLAIESLEFGDEHHGVDTRERLRGGIPRCLDHCVTNQGVASLIDLRLGGVESGDFPDPLPDMRNRRTVCRQRELGQENPGDKRLLRGIKLPLAELLAVGPRFLSRLDLRPGVVAGCPDQHITAQAGDNRRCQHRPAH